VGVIWVSVDPGAQAELEADPFLADLVANDPTFEMGATWGLSVADWMERCAVALRTAGPATGLTGHQVNALVAELEEHASGLARLSLAAKMRRR
jgi:hypothetical protein